MQTVFKEKLDSDHPSWQDDLIHRGFHCDDHKRSIACQAWPTSPKRGLSASCRVRKP